MKVRKVRQHQNPLLIWNKNGYKREKRPTFISKKFNNKCTMCNFYLLVALELKLMEESGLAACFANAVAVLCMNLAKLGVYPLLGSVGVVGSFFSKGPGAGGSGSCNR